MVTKAAYEARDTKIFTMLEGGATIEDAATAHGLSQQRVRQIQNREQRRAAEKRQAQGLRPGDPLPDSMNLDSLELSVRTFTVLRNEGWNTVGDIRRLTDAELLRCPNFGRKSLNEIRGLTGDGVKVARGDIDDHDTRLRNLENGCYRMAELLDELLSSQMQMMEGMAGLADRLAKLETQTKRSAAEMWVTLDEHIRSAMHANKGE